MVNVEEEWLLVDFFSQLSGVYQAFQMIGIFERKLGETFSKILY